MSKKLCVAFAAAVLFAGGTAAFAQQPQGGLVNVAVDDSLNNVVSGNSIAVPVELAAAICPNVNVAAIAEQNGNRNVTDCTITQDMVSNNAALSDYMSTYENKGQAIKGAKTN
jgi:hypothetical protein